MNDLLLIQSDDLLTTREAAKILRVSESTLEQNRSAGKGIRYVKIGKAVRYRRADIKHFLDAHTVGSV